MKIHPGFVGIDISKDRLDVFDGSVGRPERIPNTDGAVAARVERWRDEGAVRPAASTVLSAFAPPTTVRRSGSCLIEGSGP